MNDTHNKTDDLSPGFKQTSAFNKRMEEGHNHLQNEIAMLRLVVSALIANHPDRPAVTRALLRLVSEYESKNEDAAFDMNYPAQALQDQRAWMKLSLLQWIEILKRG